MPGKTAVAPPVRGRRTRRLLIALIVLVVVLVAADRIALVVAEQQAAKTIQNSQHLDHRPTVTVAGFPFLTQLAAGNFDKVTVRASDVPVGTGSRALTISAVTVVLHGVHVPRDFSSVRADSATAAGTVSYADLSHALGITVDYDGRTSGVGRVRTTGSLTLLGQKISGSVSAGVSIKANALTFTAPKVSVAESSLPDAAVQLHSTFGAPLPLAGLPFGVRVTRVAATPGGLTITLSGADLIYRN